MLVVVFFFNDAATTEIYTLSLHDALPICSATLTQSAGFPSTAQPRKRFCSSRTSCTISGAKRDRKSTRLNSSHANISYAVFCLKKKKQLPSRRYPSQQRHS